MCLIHTVILLQSGKLLVSQVADFAHNLILELNFVSFLLALHALTVALEIFMEFIRLLTHLNNLAGGEDIEPVLQRLQSVLIL